MCCDCGACIYEYKERECVCMCVWSCERARVCVCVERDGGRLLYYKRLALFSQEIKVFITFHEIPKSVLRFPLLGHTHTIHTGALCFMVSRTMVHAPLLVYQPMFIGTRPG
jgi:hypothetical protein